MKTPEPPKPVLDEQQMRHVCRQVTLDYLKDIQAGDELKRLRDQQRVYTKQGLWCLYALVVAVFLSVGVGILQAVRAYSG